MQTEPLKEHRWLERLAGEWTFESESPAGPGAPPERSTGTETLRSFGGLWLVGEARAVSSDGSPSESIITLGYDPERGRVVGTFVASTMAHLWIYDGELDEAANALTLYAEGPSFTEESGTALYRDVIELRSDDHRVMTSSQQAADGTWHPFMSAHYRRVR